VAGGAVRVTTETQAAIVLVHLTANRNRVAKAARQYQKEAQDAADPYLMGKFHMAQEIVRDLDHQIRVLETLAPPAKLKVVS
jgi:hypothetical protein